ncbi:uncharacterized protein LOC109794338 [Cajanus cajan]|nr:uncharacterized protein LOC109794338 [Cajanus cajan]
MVLLMVTTAKARPCRAFIITSYSIDDTSSNTIISITKIQSFIPLNIIENPPSDLFYLSELERIIPCVPLGLYSVYHYSSLYDRAKDVGNVALALFLAVVCGVINTLNMYFINLSCYNLQVEERNYYHRSMERLWNELKSRSHG